MTLPKIVVTGATGKTGSAVVAQLRQKNWPVRAVVHRRDARSESLACQGAEIVVADLYDPGQLADAMRGTERAYYCPPYQPFMIQSAVAFAVAAREARLESIVALSQWLSSPVHPALLTRQTWLADQLFAMVPDVALTIVNAGFFADNYLRMTPYAAHLGIFPSLYGESRDAPPSNEDIARVAAAALMDPARHAGRRYRPTGPALLSTSDMVEILGRVLQRRVIPMPMPRWMLLKAARMQGASVYEIREFIVYLGDHRQGAFEAGAPNDVVQMATGLPAESFEETARRYAARPEARRTVANGLKAWLDFLRTPFVPGHDVVRFEHGLMAPAPAIPRFAMLDDAWRGSHGVAEMLPAANRANAVAGVA